QAIAASAAPVCTSHNGVRHFADVIGNMTDDLLLALAERGGLIGLHSAGWLIKQRAADWNDRTRAQRRVGGPPEPVGPTSRPAEVDYGAYVDARDAEMRSRRPDT